MSWPASAMNVADTHVLLVANRTVPQPVFANTPNFFARQEIKKDVLLAIHAVNSTEVWVPWKCIFELTHCRANANIVANALADLGCCKVICVRIREKSHLLATNVAARLPTGLIWELICRLILKSKSTVAMLVPRHFLAWVCLSNIRTVGLVVPAEMVFLLLVGPRSIENKKFNCQTCWPAPFRQLATRYKASLT